MCHPRSRIRSSCSTFAVAEGAPSIILRGTNHESDASIGGSIVARRSEMAAAADIQVMAPGTPLHRGLKEEEDDGDDSEKIKSTAQLRLRKEVHFCGGACCCGQVAMTHTLHYIHVLTHALHCGIR